MQPSRRLVVIALAALAACSDGTAPVVQDPTSIEAMLAAASPAGSWRFAGEVSHYAKIEMTLARSLVNDELLLDAPATADLRCAPGETTYKLASTPTEYPCRLHGTFFGKQTSVSTIVGHFSWNEAPMSLGVQATMDGSGMTFTASVDSRANNEPVVIVNGVTFTRQP